LIGCPADSTAVPGFTPPTAGILAHPENKPHNKVVNIAKEAVEEKSHRITEKTS
jgi:hypothetical protein